MSPCHLREMPILAFPIVTPPSTLKPIYWSFPPALHQNCSIKVSNALHIDWLHLILSFTPSDFMCILQLLLQHQTTLFWIFPLLSLVCHSSSCSLSWFWSAHGLVFCLLLFSVYIPLPGILTWSSWGQSWYLLVGWVGNLLALLLKYMQNLTASYSSTCNYHHLCQ